MRLFTPDDVIETYGKLQQRGWRFLASKFSLDAQARTKSAFNDAEIEAANWWIIPQVKERWNELISGNKDKRYEDYLMEQHLAGRKELKLISIGSGICSHEIYLAQYDAFVEIKCVDIADNLIQKAAQIAREKGLDNMVFEVADIYKMALPKGHYDVVLFHSALHHLKDLDELLKRTIKQTLKKDGLLVVNEYAGPNRLQYPNEQIDAINNLLAKIPNQYKQRFRSNRIKQKVYGQGWLRMLIADPSECVESADIRIKLKKYYQLEELKPYGGNLLMLLFKDIAHNFLADNQETNLLLEYIFEQEDLYLKSSQSDFIFGVYKNVTY